MAKDDANRTFGQSISEAFRLVNEFIKDCVTLLDTLNLLMEENGWAVEKSTKSGSDRLNGDFYRLYLPKDSHVNATSSFALFQQLRVRKTDFFDEPQIALVICRYEGKIDCDKVWNRWSKMGGIRVIQALRNRGGAGELSGGTLNPEFAHNAIRGIGLVLPLCSLTNRAMLQSQVVEPILRAAAELGIAAKKM